MTDRGQVMITTSWLVDRTPMGRHILRIFAIAQHNGNPVVVGTAELDVPNLEIAAILKNGIGAMLNQQPPEIIAAMPSMPLK
jgi:hypothetical protein